MIPTPVPGLKIEDQPAHILLAMQGWGEARGEGPLGMLAANWVAVNRANKAGVGDLAPRLKAALLKPWQFSCFNNNDPNRVKLLEPLKHDAPEVWGCAFGIAQLVLLGLTLDPTRGSDHYATTAVWDAHEVSWLKPELFANGRTREVVRIGSHVFGKHA